MKKLKTGILFFICIISSQFIFAQEIDTTLQVQTLSNIDSMLNGWYVKTSLTNNNKNKDIFTNEHYVDIADSIIIERMKLIATPMQMTYNQEVRSWINLYLKRGKYMIPTIMGMSEYYFPFFEELLISNDMPVELKYLPVIESALNPRAVSKAGATGLWQFIYPTGRRYGLEVNSYIDDRKDPVKSTYAAVTHLKDLFAIFGDWNLALAAYNCGAGNVNKAIVRSGGKTDFWEIYEYLPRETRGYIPAFIAVTYILTYSKEHNFYPASITMPINTDTIMITDTLHLVQVAEVLNLPIEQLRDLNPQYKIDIIPGFVKPFALRLPSEKVSEFLINEDIIYNHRDNEIFSNKFVIKTPPPYTKSNNSNTNSNNYNYDPQPCPNYDFSGKGKVLYTVKSGDTYSFISEWFDVSLTDIKCWNDLSSNKLSVGQVLTIYEPLKKLSYYNQINTMTFEQKQGLASDRKVTSQKLDPNYLYYTVKKGDNLSTIASQFDGVTYQDIMTINSFTDKDVTNLQIGQIIKIKKRN